MTDTTHENPTMTIGNVYHNTFNNKHIQATNLDTHLLSFLYITILSMTRGVYVMFLVLAIMTQMLRYIFLAPNSSSPM